MNRIQIRKAAPQDINALLDLSRQTFMETFEAVNTQQDLHQYLSDNLNTVKLTSELNNENSNFYFAIFEDQNIGYLKINFGDAQTEIKGDHGLEIERIYVFREYQGKKVGFFLLNFAVEIGRKLGMKYIWLGVWEENLKAINFYKKVGFWQFDSHMFKLGDSMQTDIMMKMELI